MAEESGRGAGRKSKEPFVGSSDRPEVKIDLDTPLTDLTVRSLSAVLGFVASEKSPFEDKTSLKDFFDKDFPEVVKDWIKESKPEIVDKPPKEGKSEKLEKDSKNEKFEKNEKAEKNEKIEKPEKREGKEIKVEKLEHDGVFEPGIPSPDPRIDHVIGAVAALSKQVGQLADQVSELQRKKGKE
ncbi:MAG TPA: hypothetical protein VH416_00470 [Gaiellaceae bacterium]|jgi:hypothetical protein